MLQATAKNQKKTGLGHTLWFTNALTEGTLPPWSPAATAPALHTPSTCFLPAVLACAVSRAADAAWAGVGEPLWVTLGICKSSNVCQQQASKVCLQSNIQRRAAACAVDLEVAQTKRLWYSQEALSTTPRVHNSLFFRQYIATHSAAQGSPAQDASSTDQYRATVNQHSATVSMIHSIHSLHTNRERGGRGREPCGSRRSFCHLSHGRRTGHQGRRTGCHGGPLGSSQAGPVEVGAGAAGVGVGVGGCSPFRRLGETCTAWGGVGVRCAHSRSSVLMHGKARVWRGRDILTTTNSILMSQMDGGGHKR